MRVPDHDFNAPKKKKPGSLPPDLYSMIDLKSLHPHFRRAPTEDLLRRAEAMKVREIQRKGERSLTEPERVLLAVLEKKRGRVSDKMPDLHFHNIGQALGLEPSHVSYVLSGRSQPSMTTLYLICELFKLDLGTAVQVVRRHKKNPKPKPEPNPKPAFKKTLAHPRGKKVAADPLPPPVENISS